MSASVVGTRHSRCGVVHSVRRRSSRFTVSSAAPGLHVVVVVDDAAVSASDASVGLRCRVSATSCSMLPLARPIAAAASSARSLIAGERAIWLSSMTRYDTTVRCSTCALITAVFRCSWGVRLSLSIRSSAENLAATSPSIQPGSEEHIFSLLRANNENTLRGRKRCSCVRL